jgi:hypothetical protein
MAQTTRHFIVIMSALSVLIVTLVAANWFFLAHR